MKIGTKFNFKEISKTCPWRIQGYNKIFYCRPSYTGEVVISNRKCYKRDCAVFHFVKNLANMAERTNEQKT
jgi:hypothetical protein